MLSFPYLLPSALGKNKKTNIPYDSNNSQGGSSGENKDQQKAIDPEGYSGKENKLEAPGGQGQGLFNELPNFGINGQEKEKKKDQELNTAKRYGSVDMRMLVVYTKPENRKKTSL